MEILNHITPPTQLEVIIIILVLVTLGCLFIKLITVNTRLKRTISKLSLCQERNFSLQTELSQEQLFNKRNQHFFETTKQEMHEHFSLLAHKIVEEQGENLSHRNQQKLDIILTPLQEQLLSFKDQIQQLHLSQTRDQASLKQELLQLRQLNQQVSEETVNLTRALKGDKKLQGTWGEMILAKVLEFSGLTEGKEYTTQKGYRSDEQKLYKPDIIIHLPGDRDIVVDSKVSLSSWEQYVSTENKNEKKMHFKQHIQALKNHIASLSDKKYDELHSLNSLDFVLMFVPVEGAITTITETDSSFFSLAIAQNIVIVTPSTLLTTLRTIENLWQYEKQSKNALEIIKRTSALYDKFRGFTEDMEKLGLQLNNCKTSYSDAMLKLCQGRGNLVSQTQKLTNFGLRYKKEIPDTILKNSDLEENNT